MHVPKIVVVVVASIPTRTYTNKQRSVGTISAMRDGQGIRYLNIIPLQHNHAHRESHQQRRRGECPPTAYNSADHS
jgi:hypothetical protein